MDNKVIGNKATDNKDPSNKTKATHGATDRGSVYPNAKPSYLGTQNSPNKKMGGPDEKGDAGVKLAAKRAKKIIRTNTSYTDGAIAVAKRLRGE